MVTVALGADVRRCLPGDATGDGTITVEEIIIAVNNALTRCPAPLASATPRQVSVSGADKDYKG